MSKVLITATNAMTYHFLIPHIKQLLQDGFEVELACTDLEGYDSRLREGIRDLNVSLSYVRVSRSPFSLSNFKGIKDLKKIINDGDFDLIWTNEPVMSIATRLAAAKARRHGTKVMYMVHGFHFYEGSSKKSWLIYYPMERLMARFADALVAINREDYQRGQKFAFQKVFYIHGIGLNTEKFNKAKVDRNAKREEIGVPIDAIMLLSVGELGTRKNHEVAIRGLEKANNKNTYYVICGEGVLESYLKNLCNELGIAKNVFFLGYRKDIAELCKAADIYVFPSQREGLGIGALEGMASGLPLISSYINGIRDYTEEGKTGFTLDPHDSDGFARAIDELSNRPSLRKEMGEYNAEAVHPFDVNNTLLEVSDIIRDIIEK